MTDYSFDAAAARDRLVAAVQALAREQGFSRVVIGISGGKDSSVAAALCAINSRRLQFRFDMGGVLNRMRKTRAPAARYDS